MIHKFGKMIEPLNIQFPRDQYIGPSAYRRLTAYKLVVAQSSALKRTEPAGGSLVGSERFWSERVENNCA